MRPLLVDPQILEEVGDGFLSRWALLEVELRISLMKLFPAISIGLPAFKLNLVENLIIR